MNHVYQIFPEGGGVDLLLRQGRIQTRKVPHLWGKLDVGLMGFCDM
jgi:hypothetical protein